MAEKLVRKITARETPLTLEGDPAGGKPLYLYLSPDRTFLLVSPDVKTLLEHPETGKVHPLSPRGLSFVLQSGVIPTPWTIFENLYVLNIGDKVTLRARGERLELEFSHQFPYFNHLRDPHFVPDPGKLLRLLAQTVTERLRPGAPTYLFQSLGKDSNTIALALAREGLDLTCLTLSTSDRKDESAVAEKIARKLGFRHRRLPIPSRPSSQHLEELHRYFERIPLPCVDGVSLAYPLYALEINFEGSNVIDGSGNDIYMGHVPRRIEYRRQKLYSRLTFLRPLADRLPTGNPLTSLARTRSEMAGPFGFTFHDARLLFPEAEPVFPFWREADRQRRGWDYFDLKADIWGPNLEFDLVMRKVRNFATVYRANLIFPWADRKVADYVKKIPEKYLFDRKQFRNKLLLRKILKEELGLDSDALGKFSYGFDAFGFLQKMEKEARREILECKLWDSRGVKTVLSRLEEGIRKRKRIFRKLWVRLYLLSAWYNHNRYVKR